VVAGAVALLLLSFATGTIKSFAVTFGIGVGVSLIATLVFTRMFTSLILPLVKNKEKFLRFKRAEKTDVDFNAEV
jgi:preprotein translocase subunit SecD